MRGMHLRWGGWLVMTYDLRIVCVSEFGASIVFVSDFGFNDL